MCITHVIRMVFSKHKLCHCMMQKPPEYRNIWRPARLKPHTVLSYDCYSALYSWIVYELYTSLSPLGVRVEVVAVTSNKSNVTSAPA